MKASSSWDQSTFNDGMQFISVPDVVNVLGEVIRQQYIVLQCGINEITSGMSLNCSEIQEISVRVGVEAVLKPLIWSSSYCQKSCPSINCPLRSTLEFYLELFNQVVKSYCSIIFSRNGFVMSQQSDHEF